MERLRTAVRNQNASSDPWAESPVRRSSMSEGSRKMVTGPGSHFGGKQVKGNRWPSGKRSRRSERREPVIEEDDMTYPSRTGSGDVPTTQRVTKYETVYRPSSWAFSNEENRRDSGHGGDTTDTRTDDYLQGGPGRWRSSVPEAPRYSPRLQHETRKAPSPPQPPRSQQNIGVQSKMGDAVAAAAAAYCTENRIPMRRVNGPTLVSGMTNDQMQSRGAAAGKAPEPRQRGKTHHELLGYTPTGERRWRRYIFDDKSLEEQIDEEQEWVLGGYDHPPQRGEHVPETAVMVDREMLEREEAERQAADQEAAERAAADRELAEYRAAEREATARKVAEARAAERHAAEREAAEKEAARRKAAEREVAQREAAQREREERIAAEWEAERREEMEQLMQRERMITEAREREMERERQRERELEMEKEERERELEMERAEKEREIEMERQERVRIENAMRQERERLDAAASAPQMKEEEEEGEEGPETFVKEERYFFTEETVEEPMEEAAEMPEAETQRSVMPADEVEEPSGGIPAVGAWPEQGYRGREEEEEEAREAEEAARENIERAREKQMRERDETERQEEQEQREEQRMRNAREQAARQEEEQAQAAERMRQEREDEAAKQKPLSRGERRRSAKEDKAREKRRAKEEKARERESKKEARRSSKQAKKDGKEKKEDDKKRARIEELRQRQLEQQNQHEQHRRSMSQQQEDLSEQHPAAQKKSHERQGSGLFNFLSRRSSKAEKKMPEMAAPSVAAGGI